MALATKVKHTQEKIIKECSNKQMQIKEIECSPLGHKMYLFTIICTNKKVGKLKLHKSIIKQIANNKDGHMLICNLITEIDWSV